MTTADRLRTALVDGLLATGRIRSPAVEEAFRAVPRHLFLPATTLQTAYADDTVAVQFVDGTATSSASQPSMVAIMLEQLDLRPGHRVLEVGAGTGWNAALMARIVGPAGRVTTVDIDPGLVAGAVRNLADAGAAGVQALCADGALGHPDGAPYDRIVLTVGSDDVWPAWVAQLEPGGRLLLPLALRGSQLSAALDLSPDGLLHSHSLRSCGFIRLRGIGATPDVPVALPGGGTLTWAEDGPRVDPLTWARVLAEPLEPTPVAVPLAAADVWDGFGLWLALVEPGMGRLTGAGPDPARPAAVVLASAETGSGETGLAVAVPGPQGSVVHPFGAGGRVQAQRLVDALRAWAAAGSPCGSDWRLTVVPTGVDAPVPAGAVVVRKGHCVLHAAPDARRPAPIRPSPPPSTGH